MDRRGGTRRWARRGVAWRGGIAFGILGLYTYLSNGRSIDLVWLIGRIWLLAYGVRDRREGIFFKKGVNGLGYLLQKGVGGLSFASKADGEVFVNRTDFPSSLYNYTWLELMSISIFRLYTVRENQLPLRLRAKASIPLTPSWQRINLDAIFISISTPSGHSDRS